MRIVFCGSGPFAAPSLQALAARHEVAAVFTQPARPAGRDRRLRPTPLAQAAAAAGLTIVECPDINAEGAVARLGALAADVMCVADFGQFIRQPARQAAKLDAINLHGSLLPELRGAAPIAWAIIRGLARTGVTTFSLVDRMDAGDIYLQAACDIRPDQTTDDLRAELARIGADLLARTLDLLEAGTAQRRPQDLAKSTPAPQIKKADAAIDWSKDAVTIRNLIHGTWSWPGAHCRLARAVGKPVDVVIARAVAEPAPAGPAGAPGGTLDKDLCVSAGAGRIRIIELQPAGKRLMAWQDFVNGYRAGEGDRFVAIGP